MQLRHPSRATVLTAGAALVLGLFTAAHPQLAAVFGILAAVGFLTIAAWRYLGFPAACPVWIAVGLYIAVGTVGALLLLLIVPGTSITHGASPLLLSLPPRLVYRTAGLYLLSAIATLAGSYLYVVLTGRSARSTIRVSDLRLGVAGETPMLILAGIALIALLLGLTHGADTLLVRSSYIAGRASNHSLVGVGMVLGIASTLMSGYVWSSSAVRLHRAMALGVFILWLAIYMSLASRSLAVSVIAFALGVLLGHGSSQRKKWVLIAAPFIAFFALSLSLYLRTSFQHGLIPYFHTLNGTDPSAVFPTVPILTLNLLSTYANTAIPAFLRSSIPRHDLWISLNPLPGALAGWYGVVSTHRVNSITPYSALGELANYGIALLVIYCIGMGMLLSHASIVARRMLDAGRHLYSLAITAVTIMVPILSLQYTLRTVSRLLYYAVALSILAYALESIRRLRRRGT